MKNKIEICIALSILAFALFTLKVYASLGTVSVTTSETTVLAAKADRRWVILQNNSTNSIWVKADSSTNAVTTNNGILIPANGGTFTITGNGFANPARNTIKAISSVGTNTLRYQEGNEN